MAKEILPVDFKDDIMNETMEGRRRCHRIIQNWMAQYPLRMPRSMIAGEDPTGQINKTNQAVK